MQVHIWVRLRRPTPFLEFGVERATEQKPGFKDGWCSFSHGSNGKSVALCAFSVSLVG